MTVGQRIAQKRKEQNMSQEALGEKLGVSRQSIYKWESDAALPEIDKLVVLSKLFEVSVGWLLGVEEEPVRQEPPVGEEPELTENQLKMVEEIVGRYLAAQAPVKKPRRWPKVLAAVIVVLVGIHLFNRLEGLDNRYHTLQNTVGNLNHTVTNQIGGITKRVEEILKAQNSLTADYGAELLRTDLSANTVTFSMRAMPKTFVDGMSAVFLVNSGAETKEMAAEADGGTFSAEATVDLTDSISLSVVFITPDGKRQTQLLETYTGLLANSIPWVNVSSNHAWGAVPDGPVNVGRVSNGRNIYAHVEAGATKVEGAGVVEVETMQVGVFVNRKLIGWAEECDQPKEFQGDWSHSRFFCLPDAEVTLRNGDQMCVAALVTDTHGRQFMAYENPYVMECGEDGKNGWLGYAYDIAYDSDISKWDLSNKVVIGEGTTTYDVDVSQ